MSPGLSRPRARQGLVVHRDQDEPGVGGARPLARRNGRRPCPARAAAPASGFHRYSASATATAVRAITAAARRRFRTSSRRVRSRASASRRGLLLDVASPPVEDRGGEDVVVDLVAGDAAGLRRGDRSQDALALQVLERRLERARGASENSRSSSELSAIFLPPDVTRKRKRLGGGVALIGGQRGHDLVEVPVDDRVRAAQTSQRLQPQAVRSGGDLLVPEALHDQLQVRRLHAGRTVVADLRCLPVTERDPPASHLLEHRVHERGLDLEARRVCRRRRLKALSGFERPRRARPAPRGSRDAGSCRTRWRCGT